jgi:hypothetical protein
MDLHIKKVADRMGGKRGAGQVNVSKCEKEIHPDHRALPRQSAIFNAKMI